MSAVVSTEQVLDLIDAAGYSMSYWASKAVINEAKQTYTVTVSEEDDNEWSTKTITFDEIRAAIETLIKKDIVIRKDLREQLVREYLLDEENGVDADAGDCVVQVALFGTVVYG